MLLHDLVPVLQFSIGPVILISGVGLLLVSMTNRYGRVIDRCRIQADFLRGHAGGETYRAGIRHQIDILLRRGRLLRLAIALAALSILLAALLVVILFLITLLKLELSAVIIVLFFGSMACLIFSIIFFIVDINISLAALKLEIELQKTSRPGSNPAG
jgi:hypothetical protein